MSNRSLLTFAFLEEGPPVLQGKRQHRSCITAGGQSPPQDTIALVLFPLHFGKINLIGTNPDMASLKAEVHQLVQLQAVISFLLLGSMYLDFSFGYREGGKLS